MAKSMQAKIPYKHPREIGIGLIILGILILLNEYFLVVNWVNFWGIILILVGLKKLAMMKRC